MIPAKAPHKVGRHATKVRPCLCGVDDTGNQEEMTRPKETRLTLATDTSTELERPVALLCAMPSAEISGAGTIPGVHAPTTTHGIIHFNQRLFVRTRANAGLPAPGDGLARQVTAC